MSKIFWMPTFPRWVRELLVVVFALGYGVLLAALLFNFQGRISIESTDSFTYADTARQIASGQGITTKIIQPHVAAAQMPQVTWPPAFPLLVAMPMFFGVSLGQSLLTTPVVILALCASLFLWFCLRRWGGLAALLWAGLTLVAVPILRVAAQPMTESVFLGFSFLTALACWSVFNRQWGRFSLLISLCLGVLLASLGLIRYLGFALVPGVWLVLLIVRRQRELLASVVGFAALAVPFLLRNFVLDREFTNQRFPTDASFFLNVQDAFSGLAKDVFSSPLWSALWMTVAIASLAAGLWFVRKRRDPLPGAPIRFGLLVFWLAGVYLVGMIVMRSLFYFDRLNTSRFLVPVEWLALAGVACLAAVFLRRVPWLALVVALVVTIHAIRVVPTLFREPRHGRLPVSGRQIAWAAQNTEPGSLILSNSAHSYNYFLGRSVVSLREYREPTSAEDLQAWQRSWDGVFPNIYLILSKQLDDGRHTDFITGLSNREGVPDFLEPLSGLPGGIVVYRLR